MSMSKKKLIEVIDELRKSYLELVSENEALRGEVEGLKAAAQKAEVAKVNRQSNKPSSKQAEWEQKGVGNDGKGKRKKRGKKGRKGAGNKAKDKPTTRQERASVD